MVELTHKIGDEMLRALPTILVLLSCSLSFAQYDPSRRENEFKQKIGYDDGIKLEKYDGLIDVDFRKLKAPPFAARWPDKNGWKFRISKLKPIFSKAMSTRANGFLPQRTAARICRSHGSPAPRR